MHHTPYFGTREFAAFFEPSTEGDQPDRGLSFGIGTMLFDTAYAPDRGEKKLAFWRHDSDGPAQVNGDAIRLMFNAALVEGRLVEVGKESLPQHKYDELDELENRHASRTL